MFDEKKSFLNYRYWHFYAVMQVNYMHWQG